MYIIGGTASKTVAEDLSKNLDTTLARTIIKRFPDNELYVCISDDIFGEDVIIVQTTYPDQNIVELFLLQDAVKEAGAKRITVVIPYFGYGRQDLYFFSSYISLTQVLQNNSMREWKRNLKCAPYVDQL